MCVKLIDGENKRDPRGKLEETTTIKVDVLRWSTTLRLGGIDGNPVLRRTRRRIKYAYTSLIKGWQLGMGVFIPGLVKMEYLFYAIARPPLSTTRDGFLLIQ